MQSKKMLKYNYQFEAFGTQWGIETDKHIDDTLRSLIQQRIELFDSTYSRFRSDSLVASIFKAPGIYTFPSDAVPLFLFYRSLYQRTQGKVTPLIGESLSRAGYDATYSFITKPQKTIPLWDDVMSWDNSTLTTSQHVLLDVGAAGKGYMVDIIAQILDEHKYLDYVIDASGDIKHKGASQHTVGLEHPLHPNTVIGAIKVENKSICASATHRRAWGTNMHHIFDPDTTSPTNTVSATWVIADQAMIADGLATALFFTEPEILKQTYDFHFVRMMKDGSVQYSPLFETSLF
jgi:thiamine biosynthesis lipoprotein